MAKKKAKKKTAKKVKAMTQAQIFNELAERTELTKKDVQNVFAATRELMLDQINPKAKSKPGVFTLPGIARVKTRVKPARKARKGRNPFTGEEMTFKAKPAMNVIKILPVKALKDEVK